MPSCQMILTSAPAALRDSLMKGLQEDDAQFAETVEKSILPFEDIRTKLSARDVPAVVRLVDQAALVTALTFARAQPKLDATAEFILANLSQRMAQTLREESAMRGKVKSKEGEEAVGKIVAVIFCIGGSLRMPGGWILIAMAFFLYAAAGPKVRSSYRAGELYLTNMLKGRQAAAAAEAAG